MKRFIFFFYLIFISPNIFGQGLSNDVDFLTKINGLKNGYQPMIFLEKSDSVKLVSFVLDKIDDKDKQYHNEFI